MDLSDAIVGIQEKREIYTPKPERLYVMRAGKMIVVEKEQFLKEKEIRDQAKQLQPKPPYAP
ncbi:hypothetical protein KY309_02875 [Candidatus Woesearchaeota archaeon]|nr:hypothetical protein [Candidatus Woesearchaeota archaeon]